MRTDGSDEAAAEVEKEARVVAGALPGSRLLLDEPLSAVDAITRRSLQSQLLLLQSSFGKTLLMITHDVEEALLLADTVVVLSDRPMKIVECIDVAIPKPRPTLIMPEADDERMVEAAERLTKYANIVLLTTEDALIGLLHRTRLGDRMRGSEKRFLSRVRCLEVDAEDSLREEFAHAYLELGKGKKWEASIEEAREKVRRWEQLVKLLRARGRFERR